MKKYTMMDHFYRAFLHPAAHAPLDVTARREVRVDVDAVRHEIFRAQFPAREHHLDGLCLAAAEKLRLLQLGELDAKLVGELFERRGLRVGS